MGEKVSNFQQIFGGLNDKVTLKTTLKSPIRYMDVLYLC